MGASDVEAATTENRKGWLHVQDEDSPGQVVWHATLLAATLWSCARAPLAIAGPSWPSSDGALDVLAELLEPLLEVVHHAHDDFVPGLPLERFGFTSRKFAAALSAPTNWVSDVVDAP